MGYAGDLKLMLKGTFTTIAPTFSTKAGSLTLAARGLNIMHRLRTKQYSYTWTHKTPTQIASAINALTDPKTKEKRFPLPIEVVKGVKETEIPSLSQTNQTDFDFLLQLARKYGLAFFLKEEEPEKDGKPKQERRVYVGPSEAAPPQVRLDWGVSLLEFKPVFTTANQFSAVEVVGWDRTRRKVVTGRAERTELKLNRDLLDRLKTCDARELRIVDKAVFTAGEARDRARAGIEERSKKMVTASGSCIGWPDVRAGRTVFIGGVGSRFSGEYFITDSTHTIDDSGYITKFNARREVTGKQVQK